MDWSGRAPLLVLTLICLFSTSWFFLGIFPECAVLSLGLGRAEQSFEDLLRREGRKKHRSDVTTPVKIQSIVKTT